MLEMFENKKIKYFKFLLFCNHFLFYLLEYFLADNEIVTASELFNNRLDSIDHVHFTADNTDIEIYIQILIQILVLNIP